jgi:hypothetical protein
LNSKTSSALAALELVWLWLCCYSSLLVLVLVLVVSLVVSLVVRRWCIG